MTSNGTERTSWSNERRTLEKMQNNDRAPRISGPNKETNAESSWEKTFRGNFSLVSLSYFPHSKTVRNILAKSTYRLLLTFRVKQEDLHAKGKHKGVFSAPKEPRHFSVSKKLNWRVIINPWTKGLMMIIRRKMLRQRTFFFAPVGQL